MNFPFKVFRQKTLPIYFEMKPKQKNNNTLFAAWFLAKVYQILFVRQQKILTKQTNQRNTLSVTRIRLNWLNEKRWIVKLFSMDGVLKFSMHFHLDFLFFSVTKKKLNSKHKTVLASTQVLPIPFSLTEFQVFSKTFQSASLHEIFHWNESRSFLCHFLYLFTRFKPLTKMKWMVVRKRERKKKLSPSSKMAHSMQS